MAQLNLLYMFKPARSVKSKMSEDGEDVRFEDPYTKDHQMIMWNHPMMLMVRENAVVGSQFIVLHEVGSLVHMLLMSASRK